MAASMSLSDAPDLDLLGRVAGALAVDEAFVEKDWYVVQAIQGLLGLKFEGLTPVFSGGTSLLKAALIKRFSEDIDFKLLMSGDFAQKSANQRRKALGAFRDELSEVWASAGFKNLKVTARDANGFIQIEMDYPSVIEPHGSLRPHILAEVSAKPPRLAVIDRPVSSFVAQYEGRAAEVEAVGFVDPVETAADKLSALAWRMLTRDRSAADDDPAIVRHLHDLAMLEGLCGGETFPALLADVLDQDRLRGGGKLADFTGKARLDRMLEELGADHAYEDEYRLFVEGMAFAGEETIPTYAEAVVAVGKLADRLTD